MNKKIFEYAILKSENTSEIVFFIHIMSSWLEQEIEIEYINNELIMNVNEQCFTSEVLPKIAQDWLKHNYAKVYFTNDNAIVISEAIINGDNKEGYETEN